MPHQTPQPSQPTNGGSHAAAAGHPRRRPGHPGLAKIQQTPAPAVEVPWVGRETGSWASRHAWKKGYAAALHTHLTGTHVFVV
jgi:hypothetical protein